jgi:hypothetical protein
MGRYILQMGVKEDGGVGELTDTATVEHQISRLAITETPENCDGTERSSTGNDVSNSWCAFGKHMVISSSDP